MRALHWRLFCQRLRRRRPEREFIYFYFFIDSAFLPSPSRPRAGLNAVEVYAPWNVHEPYPGQFTWVGEAGLDRFVQLADDLGFLVLLRAGPYVKIDIK